MIGGFLSDIANPVSWVREKWNHWRRLFDIKGQYYSHEVRNEREYLHIKVCLTFARNIANADLLLKIYQIQMLPGHQFTHTIAESINKKKDAQGIYTLAVIPLNESENSYWGSPENPTNHSLVYGGRYIACLCIRTHKAFQEHKLYIQIATPKAGSFGKYVVFDESTAALHYLMKPTTEKDGCLFIKP